MLEIPLLTITDLVENALYVNLNFRYIYYLFYWSKCCLLQDEDQYLRTECYHYFHPLCLAQYIDLYYKEIKQRAKEDEETRWSQVAETHPQQVHSALLHRSYWY